MCLWRYSLCHIWHCNVLIIYILFIATLWIYFVTLHNNIIFTGYYWSWFTRTGRMHMFTHEMGVQWTSQTNLYQTWSWKYTVILVYVLLWFYTWISQVFVGYTWNKTMAVMAASKCFYIVLLINRNNFISSLSLSFIFKRHILSVPKLI